MHWPCFNTASGMRSHVTPYKKYNDSKATSFNTASGMRSHVTYDSHAVFVWCFRRFNTASGMRSHVT